MTAVVLAEALIVGLRHLDNAIDLVSKLVGQAPTKEQLAAELAKRGERLLTLSATLAAAQAEDQAILDARIPR